MTLIGLRWTVSTVVDFSASVSTTNWSETAIIPFPSPGDPSRDGTGKGHVTQYWPMRHKQQPNKGPLEETRHKWPLFFLQTP